MALCTYCSERQWVKADKGISNLLCKILHCNAYSIRNSEPVSLFGICLKDREQNYLLICSGFPMVFKALSGALVT